VGDSGGKAAGSLTYLPAHSLVVPPGRGEVEIHYTALSFRAPEKNRFKYKLEGVDRDWIEAEGRRVAYYNNLAPRDYGFQVIACNNDGIWNETGATVALVLKPHIWQTWWFLGLCGLTAAAAVGGPARYATRKRMHRQVQHLEHQYAIESERARIARDLHDNLGTRLTEILMHNEFSLQHSQEDGQTIRPHLEKAANLVRELAGGLDAIVWAADPKNDSLDHFILYIYEYLDSLANVTPMRLLRDVPAELPPCPLSPAQRHNLFLVVKEALSNVFKHSGATEIWFRLRLEDDSLMLALEDNGKGFVPEATSELGNGLVNMEKRMKLIGGSFSVRSQPGSGTQLRLQVPLKSAAKTED
jgi:signal transduction histidine kinase